MGYQALLFCPDEKLAKVVSQVFSELDFSIEPVHEPFAAVKRLMAQRYDAVVVDCENEQNASLLLKSARNSSHNQSSLAIALVEGQAGVAKAYRIGANLVLTKPINVEQAKGTLRVARGLLRKNSDAAATATSTGIPTPAPARTPASSVSAQPPSRPAVAPAPPVTQHDLPEFEAPAMPASPPISPAVLPTMAASARIEEEPAIAPVQAQPSEPASIPEPVSEVRQAPKSPLDDIVKNDAIHSTINVPAKSAPISAPAQTKSPSFTSVPGSAAAAAPAKEASASPVKETPQAEAGMAKASPAAPEFVTEAVSAVTVSDSAGAIDAPSFESFGEGDAEAGGGKKKILIGAVALLVVAIAGYFGYEQWGKPSSSAPPAHPASVPQNSTEPAPKLAPMSAPETAPSPSLATPDRAGSVGPSSNTKPAAITATNNSAPAGSTPVIRLSATPETETKTPAAAPIVVKSSLLKSSTGAPKAQSAGDDAAPALPSTVASANDASLSGLMSSASSSVARPSLATVRVSQGVSQGLVIKRVQPKYPQAALSTHAHGAVQIEATIDKEGKVTNVKVLNGDPMLAKAATDAVRQWRYKPYYLDGEPVEIQTQITVNFKAD